MLRTLVSGLVSAAFLVSIADVSRAQDWSGAYAGAHAGIRWSQLDLSTPAYQFSDGMGGTLSVPAGRGSFNFKDGIGGVHGGYNVLLGGGWLAGFEGDVSWGRDSESLSVSFQASRTETSTRTVFTKKTITEFVPCECSEEFVKTTRTIQVPRTITTTKTINSRADGNSDLRLGAQGTLRSRFGFVDGNWLYYATGGVAFTQVDWNDTIAIAGGARDSVSKSDTLVGFVVGGGVETFIAPQWLLRLEYLYEDFGSMEIPLAFTDKTGELDVTVHKLRVGLSLKF